MQDLHLWRSLRHRRFVAAELVPMLRELAKWPLVERLPFLGFLPPLLGHPEPELRAAAVRVLGEVQGFLGFQHVVAALQDDHPDVRLAAVEALRGSTLGADWSRWAHALFHPDPAVRRAAIDLGRLFPAPEWWVLYLLPDPACSETVRQRLREFHPPADALPVLFDYARRGVVPREQAREWAARVPWGNCYDFLTRWAVRTPEAVAEVLEAIEAEDGRARIEAQFGRDGLDELFELLADPGTATDWFRSVMEALFDYAPEYLRRVVAAVIAGAVQGFGEDQPSAGAAAPAHEGQPSSPNPEPRTPSPISWPAVCAVFHPRFLLCPWLPMELRRNALHGPYEAAERCPRLPDEEVARLLQADVCRRPDGLLDLWAVGAMLRLYERNPYQRLVQLFGVPRLLESFEADPEGAVPLLSLPDNSPTGRRFLIRELCLQPRPQRARLLAMLARVVPGDGLDFLDTLDGATACAVFEQLMRFTEAPAKPLSDKKVRRLAEALTPKIVAGQVAGFLRIWLDRPAPEDASLGQAILAQLAREHEPRFLVQAVRELPLPALMKFLTAATCCPGFPYDREIEVARLLSGHAEEGVRAWAAARVADHEGRLRPRAGTGMDRSALLKSGLCARLRGTPDPDGPNVEVCSALLASHDLLEEVDAQFARFGSADPEFARRLDAPVVEAWRGEMRLPILGHAWLYRWEQHAAAFAEALAKRWPHGPYAALRVAEGLASVALRQRFWEAFARLLEIWQWKDRPRLAAVWKPELADVLLEALPGPAGVTAARILMLWRAAAADSPELPRIRPRVVEQLVVCDELVRAVLTPWIDSRGLAAAPVVPPPVPTPEAELLERIADSYDLDFLTRHADSENEAVASAAAVRLRERRGPGLDRLADLLCRPQPVRHFRALADTLADWPDGLPLERVRALVFNPDAPPEARYRIGVALTRRGQTDLMVELLNAVATPGPVGWFTADDWYWLREQASRQGWNEDGMAVALTRSPHPHVYEPSVRNILNREVGEGPERGALVAFLERGSDRMRELRLQAADRLYRHGERAASVPVLLQREPTSEPPYPSLLAGQPADVVVAMVHAFLIAGLGESAEYILLAMLRDEGTDPTARDAGMTLLWQQSAFEGIRREARQSLRPSFGRELKLRRVADTFAWGIRVGRELTGKLFTIEMIAGNQLGYTRFTENKIYITPLPILRGEMNGRAVVRALILHEYGHHMYHRGEVAEGVWRQSEQEGLQRLLNLVSDEHLERNLRALDRRFGDQLKMLAAYAFQHTAREVPVESLLAALQGRAFEVLTTAPLEAARRWACVAVHNGRVLAQMERAGLSFARFIRALRMGLGNRHDDPKVAQGLALFRGKFRRSDMPTLYEIAKKLREIFGAETELLNSFDQDAALGGEFDELDQAGEGITDEEVQAEVQRSLEAKKRSPRERDDTKGGKGLNLGPEEHFDLINRVQPMPYDPAAHGSLAQQVTRPAQVLRRFLKELGIGHQPQRFRLTGRSFDRTRARAVVLRGDPRMLIARELKVKTDLFIGVVIDCSGSMDYRGNIEKAKLFGTLIAEAAKGLSGVDVRLFGFTDQVIYDAGKADRCAVHSLEAGGGNNDAAGLWHAAQVAKASRRRAKLLVMISDGAPTECTVTALRSLVTRLTKRMKMCCAQVAVCPLEHQCFPHHILLDEDNVEASVRQFGKVIAKLVQAALRG